MIRGRVRVLTSLVVAAGILASGCAGRGEEGVDVEDLPEIVEATALEPRRFTSKVVLGGRTLEVAGVIEDDYRYQATVSLDGSTVYEEVVVDDRRYLRVEDPTALVTPELLVELPSLHEAWPLVLQGGWVVDPGGAPPEFTAGTKPVDAPLSPQTVLAKVRYLDAANELVGLGYGKYDRNSIAYSRRNDKFPVHEEDGTRFDHAAAGYDPNAVYTTLESLQPSFEFVSLWANETMLTRVERLTELPDPDEDRYEDLYGQLERAGSSRLLALLELGEPGRRITESYTFSPAGDAVVVEPDSAAEVRLTPALTALASRVAGSTTPTPLYGRIE